VTAFVANGEDRRCVVTKWPGEAVTKDFDQSYDQIQVKAHQDAVALFEAYSRGGDNPDLKSWAAQTLRISRSISAWPSS
jgi:hypothetical protein